MTKLLPHYTAIQNAYFVRDIDEAIEQFTKAGYGPWLVSRHVDLPKVFYRGKETKIDMSAAFTQAADVQVELIQQHDDGPSCYHDVYGPGEQGFHHTAMFVPDYEQAIKDYEAMGYPCAQYFELPENGSACYMDVTSLHGHMVELYRDTPGIHQLYKAVRDLCDAIKDPTHVEEGNAADTLTPVP